MSNKLPGSSHYRPDVDGLRAIAVAAVVLYHFHSSLLRGGVVGVDIFFVISGFLISGLIFDAIQAGSFSFIDFYRRRINRIFPALLVIIAFSLVLGWFALYANEFKEMGHESFAGLLFFPNIALWKDVGYFDGASELKPLLHLWSLGVEEQFYFLWPITLLLLGKSRRSSSILVIAFISFLLNIFLVGHHREAAFYLPFSRFWEMLLGAELASRARTTEVTVPPAQSYRDVKAGIGFLSIFLSFFIVNQSRRFPGMWALMPTVGTYLIISAGSAAWVNRKILSHPSVVFMGLISYPLYLWHWPLLYFVTVMGRGAPYLWVRFIAVVVSGVLAWLTYRIIEKPIRHLSFTGKSKSATTLLILGVCFSGISFGAWNYGNRKVSDPSLAVGERLTALTTQRCSLSGPYANQAFWCLTDARGDANSVVLGDSHAHALFQGLFQGQSHRWMLIASPACPPLMGVYRSEIEKKDSQKCMALTADSLRAVNGDPRIKLVLIVMQHFQDDQLSSDEKDVPPGARLAYGLSKTISSLQDAGKEVVLVVDNPVITAHPEFCFSRPFQIPGIATSPSCAISRENFENQIAQMRLAFQKLQRKFPRLLVFDPSNIYCDNDRCSVIHSGRSFYSYGEHLSDTASAEVGVQLNSWLDERLR